MKLTLIRGLPGSGKSTLAKKLPAVHLEADMFFMQNGVYCYNPDFIDYAHQWCKAQTALALQQGHAVVVSNTFIQWWQIKPYIHLAKRHNVQVRLIEARGKYQNIHGVPVAALENMQAKYESNALIIAKISKMLPASQLCLTAPEQSFSDTAILSLPLSV